MLHAPLARFNFTGPADIARHGRMLALHRRRAAAQTPHEQGVLQAQLDATDRQIDRLVYELYGLTAEGVRIVEGG